MNAYNHLENEIFNQIKFFDLSGNNVQDLLSTLLQLYAPADADYITALDNKDPSLGNKDMSP